VPKDDLLGADGGDEATKAQRQPVFDQRVVDPVGIAAFAHEAGGLQHAEVSRDRRAADRETLGDLSSRELTGSQVLQDLPAVGSASARKTLDSSAGLICATLAF
jgi:hypothetical protein